MARTSVVAGALVAWTLLGAQPAMAQMAAKPAPVSKFLQAADLDPAKLLPPPPADEAPAAVEGRAELHRIATSARTPARLAQARHDDEVEDVTVFADLLGPGFRLDQLPATAKLFTDLRNEDRVAAKRAKAFFKRERPFHEDRALDVCDDGHDVKNSYPSGHATMGYAAAAVLAELAPGKAQAVLARASDYAESRLVCGVHYRADIEASQVLGAVLVVKLMTKPDFNAELEAARAELRAARIAP